MPADIMRQPRVNRTSYVVLLVSANPPIHDIIPPGRYLLRTNFPRSESFPEKCYCAIGTTGQSDWGIGNIGNNEFPYRGWENFEILF